MKIALIGYGKMGHIIERIARERGHEIVSTIDINNLDDFHPILEAKLGDTKEFDAPGSNKILASR